MCGVAMNRDPLLLMITSSIIDSTITFFQFLLTIMAL